MTDIQPATKAARKSIYKQQNEALKLRVELLEAELQHYKEQVLKLTTGSIPQRVINWMHEYRVPWEIFWCYEHEEWFIELDSLFPYHTESCICIKS